MEYLGVIKIFLEEGAKKPAKAHESDAGYDVYSREHAVIKGGESKSFDVGVHFDIPKGFYVEICSKSGLNVNHNLTTTGIIDAGYTGSIVVKLYNHGKTDYVVDQGDKIAQIIFKRHESPALVQVSEIREFCESERGANGFGSSGR